MSGEIDDLERTLMHEPAFVPGVDHHLRSKTRQMNASPRRGKSRRQTLAEDYEEILKNPPE